MNKKSILLILVLIIGLIFAGCSKAEDSMDYARNEMAAEAPMMSIEMEEGDVYYGDGEAKTQSASADSGAIEDFSEKIIYNVNMGLVVDSPVETAKQIKDQVSAMGGYVASSYSNKYDEYSSYVNMQIRVPSKGLNEMTEFINSLGDVEYENMYTDNVTESYYDSVARLEHYQLQADQLEELMEEAQTIEEVLLVRQELSWVQENIEVYEGRIRMWDSLVDYSTIDISITPTPTIDTSDGLIRLITLGETGRGIVRALQNSIRFVANFFSVLLRIIAALIIPAVIVAPIVWIIVRVVKRNKAKRKNTPPNNNIPTNQA